jgi:tetratricopeptide (TPR) repeat protein
MECPRCGQVAADARNPCANCGSLLITAGVTIPAAPDGATILSGPPAPTIAPTGVVSRPATSPDIVQPGANAAGTARAAAESTVLRGGPLANGQQFGARYHIIKLLGIGGMGAVYHAWDEELGVAVALKVIRPEIAADPATAEDLERRFKRELVLARQVTHKNVVRIHDLGEIDGIKYITMPYIAGRDLATVLKREGRLPPDRVMLLARQIAAGLAAAHDAGIVHRDLKPANIMVDDDGQACIMDFGIARSASGSHTVGVVTGTLEYMAPEQARGQAVDQRADIYAFGLILYDLLIGGRQSRSDSAVADLMQRMTQAPAPPRTINALIPEALDQLIVRCIEPDAAARYQTSAEVGAAIARLDSQGHAIAGAVAPAAPARRRSPLAVVAIVVVAVAAAAGVLGVRAMRRAPPPLFTAEPVSLAVVPFRNGSGDAAADAWGVSLAEILRSELGQSAQLRTVPSDRLRQVLHDLHLSANSEFDAATLRRLGEFSNAKTIVWGQFVKIGSQIKVLATLQDLRENGGTTTLNADAADENGLLAAVEQLAVQVRQKLATSPEILKQLTAAAIKPSSRSFEALRFYNEGNDLVRQGNHADAVKRFIASTQEDPQFALAYSKLGQARAALGYDEEAKNASRRAVELSEALPPAEKYLIQANDARVRNDTKKAIAAYENLALASPNDSSILFDLGSLYENTGALTGARDAFASALKHDPKSVDTLLANGRILIKLGKAADALEPLNRALSLAIQLEYEATSANVLQALGIAYKDLDKPADALNYYRQSLAMKRQADNKSGMAASLNEIGLIQARLGQSTDAAASYQEALKLRRGIGDQRGIGNVLINLASLHQDTGRYDAALAALKEALQIERELDNEQLVALCLNFIGSIDFAKGQIDDAVTYFEQALAMRERIKVPGDIADTLHNLAEASARLGRFDTSIAQYLRALELRRGAGDARGTAIESYSMGTVYEQQGRYAAAVKSKQEALEAFRTLKDRSFWMGEILSGYGAALGQAGRGAEADAPLDQALQLARELKNDVLIAQTLNAKADRLYYTGDVAGARKLYAEALQQASRTSDRHLTLRIRANGVKAAAVEQPTSALAAQLGTLAADADAAGLKYLSIECGLHRAQAMVAMNQAGAARQDLERLVGRSQNLGTRMLEAKAHYLLATAIGKQGDAAESRRHYGAAIRILDEMGKEERGADVITRADLKTVYAESRAASAR